MADFRQVGSRTIDVSGEVERELTATTERAELNLEMQFVGEPAAGDQGRAQRPAECQRGAAGLPGKRAPYQLDKAIDSHVVTTIVGSDYLANLAGNTTVEQIRRAIGDHRAAGYSPTIAVVDPSTAADLDLLATGSGSPMRSAGQIRSE